MSLRCSQKLSDGFYHKKIDAGLFNTDEMNDSFVTNGFFIKKLFEKEEIEAIYQNFSIDNGLDQNMAKNYKKVRNERLTLPEKISNKEFLKMMEALK